MSRGAAMIGVGLLAFAGYHMMNADASPIGATGPRAHAELVQGHSAPWFGDSFKRELMTSFHGSRVPMHVERAAKAPVATHQHVKVVKNVKVKTAKRRVASCGCHYWPAKINAKIAFNGLTIAF